ncbi:MAG: hypothetical protein AAF914_15870, partial [Pseudomonadota bacterium]
MAGPAPAAHTNALSILEGYRPQDGAADELMGPNGALRPVWDRFIAYLANQPPEALTRRFARGDQYLHDAGVFYRQYTGTGSTERHWPL